MLRIESDESSLHRLALSLAETIGGTVAAEMHGDPLFAQWMSAQLPENLLQFITASPRPYLLLNEVERRLIIDAVADAPHELLRDWRPMAMPGYLDHRVCLKEIRADLDVGSAERFGRKSRRIAKRLSGKSMPLDKALALFAKWIEDVEDLLRAVGKQHLLPQPEGDQPTPTHAEPVPKRRRERHQGRQGVGGTGDSKSTRSTTPSGWLSTDQIRKRVRVRRETVLAAMDADELPFEQRGRARYARLSDVEAWEQKRLEQPQTSAARGLHPDLKSLA